MYKLYSRMSQWLGHWSLVVGLSLTLICARSVVDSLTCNHFVGKPSTNYANSAFHPSGVSK